MTVESWIEEFYPVTAKEAGKLSDLEAAKHSLQKWKGALKENQNKHNVAFSYNCIFINGYYSDWEKPHLEFDSESCALCQKYIHRRLSCSRCPIYVANGRPCFIEYESSQRNMGALPMIYLLESTVKFLEGKNETEI